MASSPSSSAVTIAVCNYVCKSQHFLSTLESDPGDNSLDVLDKGRCLQYVALHNIDRRAGKTGPLGVQENTLDRSRSTCFTTTQPTTAPAASEANSRPKPPRGRPERSASTIHCPLRTNIVLFVARAQCLIVVRFVPLTLEHALNGEHVRSNRLVDSLALVVR